MTTLGPLTFRKKLLFNCILVLFTFVVALILLEIAVRIGAAVTNRIPLVVSDARTGWVLRPNLRNELRSDSGGHFIISTNADGHRLTAPVGKPQSGTTPVVILVGDSMVQGLGVDDTETFAWILARDTPWTIVNLGVLGYGTDQELLSLAAYLKDHPNLNVQEIFVFVFDNDFVDVQTKYDFYLGHSKPHFQVSNGRLEPEAYKLGLSDRLMDISYFYWLFNSKRALLFARPNPDGAGGINVVIACLTAMRDIAAKRGVRFHVLVHHRLRNSEPVRWPIWDDYMRLSGVIVIDITERLRALGGPDPVGYDGTHWSAEGHRRAAAIVKESLYP